MEVAENYLGQITHVIDPDNFSMQVGTGMTTGVGGNGTLEVFHGTDLCTMYSHMVMVHLYNVVFQFVDHIYYYGIAKISHEKVMIYDGI